MSQENENLLEIIRLAEKEGKIELDLSGQQLNTLPPEIGNLTQLKKLILGKYQYDKNGEIIGTIGNNLSVLPVQIGLLTHLEKLQIVSNKLSSLPPEITKLTSLQSLDISRNQLSTLPSEIRKLTKLHSLDISGNKLSSLPSEFVKLTKLQSLDISRNQLSSLPSEIDKLTKLQTLRLSDNKLSSLPPDIRKLTKLQTLHLNLNQLSSLPSEIVKLTKLQTLHLNLNQLSSLPSEIDKLTNLQSLDISYNKLSHQPSEIDKLTNLQSLDISGNQLSTLPLEIVKLTNLQSLDISYNQLNSLPSEIDKLTNLQSLDISYNQLSSLPLEIVKLTNLQFLDISYNKLSSLPSEFVELPNLQSLDISGNQLSSLPSEFVELTYLQSLGISYNKLSSLPSEIVELPNLQSLDISYNKLSSLPPKIGKLTKLQSLDISGNQLSSLPQEISQLLSLQSLNLRATNLSGFKLSGFKLSHADLSYANLSYADLSNANLSHADLSNANLSYAKLSHATLSDLKGLETADLNSTVFSANFKGELENVFQKRQSSELIKKLNCILDNEKNKEVDGPKEFSKAIKDLKEILGQELNISDENLDKLVEIAFVLSFKKEESSYPKFHLYVQEKKEGISPIDQNEGISPIDQKGGISPIDQKGGISPIVNFKNQIYIELFNLANLTRLGLGTSQKSCALLIEEEIKAEKQKVKYNLVTTGIIKIESKHEFFQELLNNETKLGGLLLSIEAPGRLRILYNLTHALDMQLALVEGKIKVYFDPINNPLANKRFITIAENLIPESDRKDLKKLNELKIIIQRVWHVILQLAVEFGHGSQLVIIPKKCNNEKELFENFNFVQYVTQPNLGEYIKKFFKPYYEHNFKENNKDNIKDNINKTLLTHYHQMLTCIDSIARLSTIDGSIILDDSLSLIGFNGEIKNKNDDSDDDKWGASQFCTFILKGAEETLVIWLLLGIILPIWDDPDKCCFNTKIDPSYLVLGMPIIYSNEEESEVIITQVEKDIKWRGDNFGTRHRSAARLCTKAAFNPFVFVVSQTGDIREFTRVQKDNQKEFVGILGPLRPL